MKKENILWILLDSVFLIVFNLLFFILGGTIHPVSVWMAYGFITFSYLCVLITPFLVKNSSQKAVLGFPLYQVSSGYFILTFVAGIIFILLASEDFRACLVVNVVLTGLYLILTLSTMIANERTAASVARHEKELQYVKESSEQLRGIADGITDKKLRKKVESLYDLVHASPVKSNEEARQYELDVMELIDRLETQLGSGNTEAAESTMARIRKCAEDRNRKLKRSN